VDLVTEANSVLSEYNVTLSVLGNEEFYIENLNTEYDYFTITTERVARFCGFSTNTFPPAEEYKSDGLLNAEQLRVFSGDVTFTFVKKTENVHRIQLVRDVASQINEYCQTNEIPLQVKKEANETTVSWYGKENDRISFSNSSNTALGIPPDTCPCIRESNVHHVKEDSHTMKRPCIACI